MNQKQRLGYMALGAGILAVGIIIGQIITPDIEAQSNGVFDKIQCREIEVVDKDGETAIRLYTTKHGGDIRMDSKDGRIANMGIGEDGGVFYLSGKDSVSATMLTKAHGGIVEVSGNGGSAEMGTDEHGGRVDVFNNQDKNRAAMGVDAFGNGVVSTWDKNGDR